MAATTEILRSWRQPRAVMAGLLRMGPREDRALAYLMIACFVIFVAQWPRLSREAYLQGTELSELVAYELFGWLFVWPLVFYILAGLSHLIARLVGGQGTYSGARLALFWALLAATPMALFYGLLMGLNGNVAATKLVGILWGLGFLRIWITSLHEAEKKGQV